MSELNVSGYKKTDFELIPSDHGRLSALCGQFNENISQIERSLAVEINCRGNKFSVVGDTHTAQSAKKVLTELYMLTAKRKPISSEQVHLSLQENQPMNQAQSVEPHQDSPLLKTKHGAVKPRGKNQIHYVQRVLTNDISFGIGPAGTGKTYLAVAAAVDALLRDEVSRIILTRPAVEAGERLGFLPGDLAQKVDPYLRPLYDALYEMLGFERVAKLMERHVIEIAPLAYMRGRTLNEAFVILDESQNTTCEQMKMLLTRTGFNSKVVITGDITQVDLPKGVKSGLRHAMEILPGVKNVSFTHFEARDVVRHKVVQSIIEAYEKHEKDNEDPHA